MKASFRLTGLDCAACAAKLEAAIASLDGVAAASVGFITQKLSVEAPDEQFDAVLASVRKTVARVNPDVQIA